MNLFQKLIEIRKTVEALEKDTQGFGYTYVSGNQILGKIKDMMNELQLVLMPSAEVGEHYIHEYMNANQETKVDFLVKGSMSYTWINAENPEETYTVPWAYYGQQNDVSKAFGSGLTYSERYFWLKILGIPTDSDDPDARDTNSHSAAPRAQRAGTQRGSQRATYDNAKTTFSSAKKISVPQQKRLFAIAGGQEVIDLLLEEHELKSEADILMGEQYNAICAQAEALKLSREQG